MKLTEEQKTDSKLADGICESAGHAHDQAKAQLESVTEMTDRLLHCQECDGTDEDGNDCQEGAKGGDTWNNAEEYHNEDAAQQIINEDALSAEIVKSYEILLCTGGPAARIVGELNDGGEPTTARLEYQDWGTPWTEYETNRFQYESLMKYVEQFYFGE